MNQLHRTHQMKKVNGHIEIFDFFNHFICSGDNEEDALEGYRACILINNEENPAISIA